MRFAKLLLAALWLVAAGCGDDSSTTGGSGGTAGAGGMGGIDAPMIDAPGGTGGTGGMTTDGPRPDAALNDAGQFTTTVTPNSVPCAAGPCTTPTDVCCGQLTDAGSVSVMCEAAAMCPMNAPLNVACDGPEDCNGNMVCCGRGGFGGGLRSSCTTAGNCTGGMAGRPLCHNHTQCPTAGDSCCQLSLQGNVFTGRCYAAGMEPPGTACDTP